MTFQQNLDAIVAKNNSLLCVGLDPVMEKLPLHLRKTKHPFFEFNKKIIDATADLVCCYKPNSAFYEALGEKGIGELKKTCDYLRKNYPKIPVLLDFKRGDIGNTNKAYAEFAFDYLGVDAVTLQPYSGIGALQPFLDYSDKGLFILCKTSNTGSDEFQNLNVIESNAKQSLEIATGTSSLSMTDREPFYKVLAQHVAKEWNNNNNLFLVVGATYPEELQEVRNIVGDMTILVPGLGAQGGEVGSMTAAGLNSQKKGMIINSSRDIVYASSGKDFSQKAREKAKELRDTINTYR